MVTFGLALSFGFAGHLAAFVFTAADHNQARQHRRYHDKSESLHSDLPFYLKIYRLLPDRHPDAYAFGSSSHEPPRCILSVTNGICKKNLPAPSGLHTGVAKTAAFLYSVWL
jgi:hypothetical protein